MKWTLRTFDHIGGKAYALFDEDGHIVPIQREIVIKEVIDEMTTVTVTFVVDGDHLRIAESQ